MRIGRLMCVFKIPVTQENIVFPGGNPTLLAYINLFTKPKGPQPNGSFLVEPAYYPGTDTTMGIVVRVTDIVSACQLAPKFEGYVPREWNKENVLELCLLFYVNQQRNAESFVTIY